MSDHVHFMSFHVCIYIYCLFIYLFTYTISSIAPAASSKPCLHDRSEAKVRHNDLWARRLGVCGPCAPGKLKTRQKRTLRSLPRRGVPGSPASGLCLLCSISLSGCAGRLPRSCIQVVVAAAMVCRVLYMDTKKHRRVLM